MFPFPPKNSWTPGALIGLALACSGASPGQDFSLRLAGADRMLRDGILPRELFDPLLDPTMEGLIKGQVAYSLSTVATYTSNASLAGGGDGDLILSVNPAAYYTTDPEGGAKYLMVAYYAPSYQHYFKNSSRGGFNQNGGVSFSTSGARAEVGAFFNVAQSSGADRIVGDYSEATIYNGGLSLSYQVAPRTSVWSSFTASRSDYSTGGADSEVYSAQLGANWAATERLSMGPSLRYNRAESGSTGVRTATGLLFNVNYLATERINLSASIGAEVVDNSRLSGSEDPSLTGDFSLGYTNEINGVWSTSTSIRYVTIPAPGDAGSIVNDLSINAAVSRALGARGSLSAGAGYSISTFERVDPTAASQDDDKTLNLFLSYSRPLPWERASFFCSASYSRSFSRDWTQWSVSTGLSIAF